VDYLQNSGSLVSASVGSPNKSCKKSLRGVSDLPRSAMKPRGGHLKMAVRRTGSSTRRCSSRVRDLMTPSFVCGGVHMISISTESPETHPLQTCSRRCVHLPRLRQVGQLQAFSAEALSPIRSLVTLAVPAVRGPNALSETPDIFWPDIFWHGSPAACGEEDMRRWRRANVRLAALVAACLRPLA
jgi:hypothetical protein